MTRRHLALALLAPNLACSELAGLSGEYCEKGVDCEGDTGDKNGELGGASSGGTSSGDDTSTGGTNDGRPALPSGRLAFQRSPVGSHDRTGVYLATLPEGELSPELGAAFGLCWPREPSFGPEGKYLVVTAISSGDSCASTNEADREVYLLNLGDLDSQTRTPIRVTNVNERVANPQFGMESSTAEGDYIYFELGDHISRWLVPSPVTAAEPFSSCNTPASSLCLAGSGTQRHPTVDIGASRMCYTEGNGGGADIYCVSLQADLSRMLEDTRELVVGSDIGEEQPRATGQELYFEVQAADAAPNYELARLESNGKPALARFPTENGQSYRSPTSLDGNLIAFDLNDSALGSVDVYVGQFGQREIWSLDELTGVATVNSSDDETGVVFSAD